MLHLLLAVAAHCFGLVQTADAKPLSVEEITRLLEAGVTPNRIENLVTKLGVSFELDADNTRELESAGATPRVLESIQSKQAAATPPDDTAETTPAATPAKLPPSPAPTDSPAAADLPSPTTRPEPAHEEAKSSPGLTALIIRSNALEDSVAIDGRDVGPSGPRTHAVMPGWHVVEVYTATTHEQRDVEVQEGETLTLRFHLSDVTTPASPTHSPAPAPPAAPRVWSPGSGPCKNLDSCVTFTDRRLDRSVCGGALTLSFRNSCQEPIVARICSQSTDRSASCQFVEAAPRATAVGRFCESLGRFLWAARNRTNPGGACWPPRLKDGAHVSPEVSSGGHCTILDDCIKFERRSVDDRECGGKLSLEFTNACSEAVAATICARQRSGKLKCEHIPDLAPAAVRNQHFCGATGAYQFAARRTGDWGDGCWPEGFDTPSMPGE